jgi:hypothetical protein
MSSSKQDIELIETRVKRAKEHYSQNYSKQQKGEENDSEN